LASFQTKHRSGTSSILATFAKQNLQHRGIEPRTSAWKADILPLN
jgi:hypothetical protein